jgi:hypothetical protein
MFRQPLSESSTGLIFILAVFEAQPFQCGFLSEKKRETLCIAVHEEREKAGKGGEIAYQALLLRLCILFLFESQCTSFMARN